MREGEESEPGLLGAALSTWGCSGLHWAANGRWGEGCCVLQDRQDGRHPHSIRELREVVDGGVLVGNL